MTHRTIRPIHFVAHPWVRNITLTGLLLGLASAPATSQRFPSPFTPLGPDGSVPYSGRVRAASINPDNPDDIWLGAASGGLWRTIDGGQTWRQADDFLPSLAVSSLARDPSAPGTLYAGTGEIFTLLHALESLNLELADIEGIILRSPKRGAGILKTTDNGRSWQQLRSTRGFSYVQEVAIHPQRPTTVLAATSEGLFHSPNAGASWRSIRRFEGQIVLQVAFDQSGRALASTLEGIYYSTDTRATRWEKSALPVPVTRDTRFLLEPWPVVGPEVWLSSALYNRGSNGHSLLVSHNGGKSFEALRASDGSALSDPIECQPRAEGSALHPIRNNRLYTGLLWADPESSQKLILGGVTLCRTTDGGRTWREIDPQIHNDHHLALEHPTKLGRRIYLANDGGFYRVDDYDLDPATQSLNEGLFTVQVHGADRSPLSGVVHIGAQDVGTYRRDSVGLWREVLGTPAGSDGIQVETDPADSDFWYYGKSRGRIRRTAGDDSTSLRNQVIGCRSPEVLEDMATDSRSLCSGVVVRNRCTNNTPVLLDSTDGNTLYVGCRRLWRTQTAKAAPEQVLWQAVKPASGNHTISTMAIAPSDPDVMWVGTYRENAFSPRLPLLERGEIWVTSELSSLVPQPGQWQLLQALSSDFPDRPVTAIALDSQRADVGYVAYGGWSTTAGPSLIRVEVDYGTSVAVQDISKGLPDGPVSSVAVHPKQSDWIYAGTEVGLFVSKDAGASWSATSIGPGRLTISDLEWISDRRLLVSTYGRGVFEYRLDSEPELVHIEDIKVLAGELTGGRVEHLLIADDREVSLESELGSAALELTGTVAPLEVTEGRAQMEVFVLTSVGRSLTGAELTVEAFHSGVGDFVPIDVRVVSTRPELIRLFLWQEVASLINKKRQVRLRLRWQGLGVQAIPFEARVDGAIVRIRREADL